jgi:hypothetical protein
MNAAGPPNNAVNLAAVPVVKLLHTVNTCSQSEVPVFETFSTPHNRKRTFLFLAACCIFSVGAALVTVSDNPPGIALALLAAAAFILAFVHPWRTARQYGIFFLVSVAGFVLFAILHNVLDAVATLAASVRVVHSLLEGLSVAAFLLAILICPPAMLVGAVGWVIMLIRFRRGRT